MKPDDKPKRTDEIYEDPKLYVVIGNEILPRAGLETAFVDFFDEGDTTANDTNDKDGKKIIGGSVCSCNKVRVTSCGCVGYVVPTPKTSSSSSSPSRSRESSRKSGGGGGCRCAPVH